MDHYDGGCRGGIMESNVLGVYVLRCCLLCIYMPAIDRSLSDCIHMPAIDRSLSDCDAGDDAGAAGQGEEGCGEYTRGIVLVKTKNCVSKVEEFCIKTDEFRRRRQRRPLMTVRVTRHWIKVRCRIQHTTPCSWRRGWRVGFAFIKMMDFVFS